MKKLLAMILALTMILSLTACGAPAAEPDPEPSSEPTSDAAEAAPEPEPATLEGIVKEVTPDKLIITLADGSDVALSTSGIAGLEAEAGDTVRAEYTGAVGAMTASRVEVTAKAEKEIVTVSGVVTGLDDEYVYLTLEDGTEAALRTVSMEEGEVEEGDTLTIHYTDGGGTILSIDVTKAEKEPEVQDAAVSQAASSQASSSQAAQGTPAGNSGTAASSGSSSSQAAKQADETYSAVVSRVDRSSDMTYFRLKDGSETMIRGAEAVANGLNGRNFQAGDEVMIGYTGSGMRISLAYITLVKAGAATTYDDDEEDYTPSSKSSSGGSSKSQAQAEPEPPEDAGDVYEAIWLINVEREKEKLSKLEIDSTLMEMAQIRDEEMSVKFEHYRPDGSYYNTIFGEYNYDYRTSVENGGAGKDTAAKQVVSWMNSSGHKANILNDSITKIGVGYFYDSNSEWKHYWTMIGAK